MFELGYKFIISYSVSLSTEEVFIHSVVCEIVLLPVVYGGLTPANYKTTTKE